MKLTKSSLKKLCLKIWSKVIREKENYTCQWCYKKSISNHAHHIVSRGLGNILSPFDIRNGQTLCYRCHMFRLKADVDSYVEFRDKWLAKRGLNYNDMRAELTKLTYGVTLDDYLVIYDKLKNELKKIEEAKDEDSTFQEDKLPILQVSKKASRPKQNKL